MAERENLSDEQTEKLISILRREEQDAYTWQDAALTSVREKSLRYYDRELIGDEVDGQSKVVTSEYPDTIESLMPPLVRAFTSAEQVAKFTPDQPGDEQWAEQASQYIPHVLMRENEGFRLIYWFVKDALMHRLSWMCVDIEEVEKPKSKDIPSIPADAWAVLRQALQEEADRVGAEIEFDVQPDMPGAMPEPEQADDAATDDSAQDDSQSEATQPTPPQQIGQAPAPTVSGTVTTTRKMKRVVIDNIAPEDGLVNGTAREIDEASFVGYRKRVTASQLRLLGINQDRIDELSSDKTYTVEQTQRQPDVVQTTSGRDNRDDSERPLWLVVAYVRFDADDDGISEMLRVVYAHAGGEAAEIVEQSEWEDGVAPIVVGSPILMSHTIPGRSIFDQVQDLQDIGTAIARGMLDNMYLVNRPRPVVSDKVNLLDLLDWTPGQPVRLSQGAMASPEHVSWLQVPSTIGASIEALNWKDQVQQRRTGVTPNNQGVPDAAMNPTATGASLITSAADQRIQLMAMTLAEAIKRLYRLIYRAVKRAASGPIKYWAADDWAKVDPTQWPDDMRLEVMLGGAGNQQQQIANLGVIASIQEKLVQAQQGTDGPLVTKDHIATLARKMVEAAGFKATSQFIAGPKELKQALAQAQQAQGQAQPPPDPAMLVAQHQMQVTAQKAQAEIAIMQQKAQSDIAIARMKAQADIEIARQKMQLKAQADAEQLQRETQLKALSVVAHPTPNDTQIKQVPS